MKRFGGVSGQIHPLRLTQVYSILDEATKNEILGIANMKYKPVSCNKSTHFIKYKKETCMLRTDACLKDSKKYKKSDNKHCSIFMSKGIGRRRTGRQEIRDLFLLGKHLQDKAQNMINDHNKSLVCMRAYCVMYTAVSPSFTTRTAECVAT